MSTFWLKNKRSEILKQSNVLLLGMENKELKGYKWNAQQSQKVIFEKMLSLMKTTSSKLF